MERTAAARQGNGMELVGAGRMAEVNEERGKAGEGGGGETREDK